jgi:hypothetical protein
VLVPVTIRSIHMCTWSWPQQQSMAPYSYLCVRLVWLPLCLSWWVLQLQLWIAVHVGLLFGCVLVS